jgi:hypothetical protein
MTAPRPATESLPLCRPAGWAALWRRLANAAALNA